MAWREIIVRAPASRVAALEALLQLAGAAAVSLADAADVPLLEPEPSATPLWPDVVVRALFTGDANLDGLEAVLAAELPAGAKLEVETLDEDAWRDAARSAVPPRRFGRRLWLLPAEAESPGHADAVVRLHLGLAFGTGRHPTTALCLEWLDAQDLHGCEVLDYGSGSGVLALAALALGAERAWAVDNDAQAVAATAANAILNAAGERLWVGPPDALPAIEVDLAVANILASPLLERAALFARSIKPGGHIVLSGVLESQREAMLAAYAPYFEDLRAAAREGWVRISGRRRRGGPPPE